MDNFEMQRIVKETNKSLIYQARNKDTNQQVIIKKLLVPYSNWQECKLFPDIRFHKVLIHQNINKPIEAFKINEYLYLAYSEMQGNLREMMSAFQNCIPEDRVKNIVRQILLGLKHIHEQGYFHFNLKPEHILKQNEDIKICDFSLIQYQNPLYYTPISIEYDLDDYSSPEQVLFNEIVTSKTDIFSLGIMIIEMLAPKLIFEGKSQIQKLNYLVKLLGTPDAKQWPEGYRLASKIGYTFPNCRGVGFEFELGLSNECLQIIKQMLRWNPVQRITASELLNMTYFQIIYIPKELMIQGQRKQETKISNAQNNFTTLLNLIEEKDNEKTGKKQQQQYKLTTQHSSSQYLLFGSDNAKQFQKQNQNMDIQLNNSSNKSLSMFGKVGQRLLQE